ncbi:hypothetical protein [Croceivirga thetidis]|uniref:HTH La-type RNA-binding domain-containing protein n=1 Tax=Croceivirga thetidis TaxID=2721623 RepID=A0ABX1GM85_9FLAO|nr:hypothetical protein [Croceivirga thetidis]NKI30734.1 hypothetical protein [Croceivirga thetidis]
MSNQERTDRLVEEKMEEIDMNSVEQYPLFADCDETATKMEQERCFQNQLLNQLNQTFKDLSIQSEIDLSDTLWLDLKIDENGYTSVAHIFQNTKIETSIRGLKEKITRRLNDSIKIEPALKRGIPVGIKVRLPIVIETTN